MRHTLYRGRRARQWENEHLRVTVLVEGCHIAELLHKASGVNPLWTPPWLSIEPSDYSASKHPEYGTGPEAKLLAGIMGHNWCVDHFGPPSPEEAAAGYTVHGEASIVPYDDELCAHSPLSQLMVKRELCLNADRLHIRETVRNLLPFDRQIAWQEHVTLGPPFVARGVTRIEAPVLRSARLNEEEFEWGDRVYPRALLSSDYHTHLLSKGEVKVVNDGIGLSIGYEWNLQDFPWLGVWEENCERDFAPWNGETMTWGIEFGASPYPEPRFRRVTRGMMWAAPTGVWLPALSSRSIEYSVRVW